MYVYNRPIRKVTHVTGIREIGRQGELFGPKSKKKKKEEKGKRKNSSN
jgi:hypothetical protein